MRQYVELKVCISRVLKYPGSDGLRATPAKEENVRDVDPLTFINSVGEIADRDIAYSFEAPIIIQSKCAKIVRNSADGVSGCGR